MKTRTMNWLSLQDIVRFGVFILAAIHVFALFTEGATNNLDYPISRDYDNAPKTRSKLREIRGFKPHSMSTAIGFGKRQSNAYQSSKLNQHETMLLSAVKGVPERFFINGFIKFFKMNPELARKVEQNLELNEGNVRPSIGQRYKKSKNDVAYYYDE